MFGILGCLVVSEFFVFLLDFCIYSNVFKLGNRGVNSLRWLYKVRILILVIGKVDRFDNMILWWSWSVINGIERIIVKMWWDFIDINVVVIFWYDVYWCRDWVDVYSYCWCVLI